MGASSKAARNRCSAADRAATRGVDLAGEAVTAERDPPGEEGEHEAHGEDERRRQVGAQLGARRSTKPRSGSTQTSHLRPGTSMTRLATSLSEIDAASRPGRSPRTGRRWPTPPPARRSGRPPSKNSLGVKLVVVNPVRRVPTVLHGVAAARWRGTPASPSTSSGSSAAVGTCRLACGSSGADTTVSPSRRRPFDRHLVLVDEAEIGADQRVGGRA